MPKPLKIAYFLQHFPQLTETFILREMLLLRNLGVDVHVFSVLPPIPSKTMHDQVKEMMPYVHYSPFLFSSQLILANLYFILHSPLKYFRALYRAVWQTIPESRTFLRTMIIFPKSVYFAKQLKESDFEHIHAHFVALSGIAAQIAADLTGITYSLHAHAYDIFMRNQESVRRELSLATGIITVSEYHRKYIADLCPCWQPSDIHIVHYGIDPERFISNHLEGNTEYPQIISVGSLFEKKGHEYLIDACKRLLDDGYQFRCSIVGSGYLLKNLQQRIDEKGLHDYVLLLGAKNQEEILSLYNKSDIFVLACVIAKSGDRDGMPNVLLEAMAMQLPVITTPVTGNPELVHDGENGILVPERDVNALTIALERLVNDPALRDKLGVRGRQTVIEDFDIHKTAIQIENIFEGFRM